VREQFAVAGGVYDEGAAEGAEPEQEPGAREVRGGERDHQGREAHPEPDEELRHAHLQPGEFAALPGEAVL